MPQSWSMGKQKRVFQLMTQNPVAPWIYLGHDEELEIFAGGLGYIYIYIFFLSWCGSFQPSTAEKVVNVLLVGGFNPFQTYLSNWIISPSKDEIWKKVASRSTVVGFISSSFFRWIWSGFLANMPKIKTQQITRSHGVFGNEGKLKTLYYTIHIYISYILS